MPIDPPNPEVAKMLRTAMWAGVQYCSQMGAPVVRGGGWNETKAAASRVARQVAASSFDAVQDSVVVARAHAGLHPFVVPPVATVAARVGEMASEVAENNGPPERWVAALRSSALVTDLASGTLEKIGDRYGGGLLRARWFGHALADLAIFAETVQAIERGNHHRTNDYFDGSRLALPPALLKRIQEVSQPFASELLAAQEPAKVGAQLKKIDEAGGALRQAYESGGPLRVPLSRLWFQIDRAAEVVRQVDLPSQSPGLVLDGAR